MKEKKTKVVFIMEPSSNKLKKNRNHQYIDNLLYIIKRNGSINDYNDFFLKKNHLFSQTFQIQIASL